jgi:outer membrane receptor protein involved in Fe transport
MSFEAVATDYEERAPAFATQFANREDRYTLRGLWQGQRGGHALSLGASAELRRLGLRSPGFPNAAPSSELFPTAMPRWNTRVLALFGEDQWQIDGTWRLLTGLRVEDHTYLGLTWSPRVSLSRPVFDDGQLTLTVARAQRGGFEDELYAAHGTSVDNQVETQDSVELLYRQPTEWHGYFEASLFAARLDAIGFVQSGVNTVNSRLVGEQRHHGAELSWRGRWAGADWTVSNAWLALESFHFEPGITDTQITAAPNGYGSALNGYAGHLSKLSARGQIGAASEWWLGMVWYHDFDGTRDRLRLLDDRRIAAGLGPQATDRGNAVAGANRYLHAGWLWRASPAVEVGAHAYNLLGLYEERWNKRNYLNNVSQYRVQAPALALSLRWRFD